MANQYARWNRRQRRRKSALTGLKATIGLIDDVDPALPAHQTIVAVPAAQGFQGIPDFHVDLSCCFAGYIRSPPRPANASRTMVAAAALLYSWAREFKPCSAAVTVS
jgi:hypothetical protein